LLKAVFRKKSEFLSRIAKILNSGFVAQGSFQKKI
jgi:hypothetical protein